MIIFPKNHVIFMQKWIHHRLSPSLFVLPTPLNFNHFNISHGSFIYLLTTPSLSNLAIFTILTRITLHFSLPTFLFSHKQKLPPPPAPSSCLSQDAAFIAQASSALVFFVSAKLQPITTSPHSFFLQLEAELITASTITFVY